MQSNSPNTSRKNSYTLKKVRVSLNEDGKVIKIEKPQTGKILTSFRYSNISYFDERESELTIESEHSIGSEEAVSNTNDYGSYNQLVDETSDILPRRRLTVDFDYSAHPSYTRFKNNYEWISKLRYQAAKNEYEKQLQKEVAEIINTQPTIVHQYFTEKLFVYTTIWPPMHSQRELEVFKKKFFQLSPKQKKRLNYLMETNCT